MDMRERERERESCCMITTQSIEVAVLPKRLWWHVALVNYSKIACLLHQFIDKVEDLLSINLVEF